MQFCAKARRRKVFNEMTTYVRLVLALKRGPSRRFFAKKDSTKELFRRSFFQEHLVGIPTLSKVEVEFENPSLILVVRGSATSDKSFAGENRRSGQFPVKI